MGMNKAARMMMMNRSENHDKHERGYNRDERMNNHGYRDNRNDKDYYGDERRYMDNYRRMDDYEGRGKYYDEYNHENHERRNNYDGRQEIRAGGTFWMDNPHKKKFDRKTAEEWVEDMESRDGTKGGKWTYDQTTQVMKQKGFECDPVDFFVAMNAIYSDYGKTLAKHGVTSADAYAELAYDWVKDPDAHKDKAARYYEYIVK